MECGKGRRPSILLRTIKQISGWAVRTVGGEDITHACLRQQYNTMQMNARSDGRSSFIQNANIELMNWKKQYR